MGGQPAKRLVRQTRAWAAVFGVAAAISGVQASTALALPVDFWGVAPQATPTFEQLERIRAGGVESIRLPIDWATVQPTKGGPLNWALLDEQVGNAAAAGIDVLPFISGAPTWAVPSAWVPGSHHSAQAPKNLPVRGGESSAWANFLGLVVARYGPSGSFWAQHPAVPQRPIRTWQIWNEENFKYFVTQPNPAEYAKLVKASYAAIKGADPGAKVVLGGMFAWPKEARYKRRPRQAYFAAEFLKQMYASAPGIKSKFDGVALHPYASTYKSLRPQIEEVRRVLMANHDIGTGLWITEMGWSSQPATAGNSFAKGPAGQAAQLRGAFTLLRDNQRKWRLQRVYWFSVDDEPGACNFCDGSGLFGPGFTPKPSWYAYVKFTGGRP